MVLTKIATLLALLQIAVAFIPPGNDDVRPWTKKNKEDDTFNTVPEDTIILDLSEKKSYTLECPIEPEKKDEVTFATWFLKKKETDKEMELSYIQGRYDFPEIKLMTIENLRPDDEGLYICKKGIGNKPVKHFRILILEMLETTKSPSYVDPPVWLRIPKRIIRGNSRRMIMTHCIASKKTTKVRVYQLKDDGTVFKEFKDQSIVIHRPTVDNTGEYMCEATNSAGRIEYRFNIEVIVDGKWGNWDAWGPCDKECGFGFKTRNRECNNPAPAGGGRQCDGDSIERYRCQTRSCQAPHLKKFGFEITDDALLLSCKASGIPTPSVQWFYNGKEFPLNYDSRNPEFRIPKNKARRGSYSCTIRNDIGFVTMYINIVL